MKFDRVEIAFILTLFYLLKPLTDEGGAARLLRLTELKWHLFELNFTG